MYAVIRRPRAFTFLALLVAAGAALAQYPSKPITFIVPNGPGSAADVIMRSVAEPLSAALRQTVIIENRAGANTDVGVQQGTKAAPDGYVLFQGSTAMVANAAGLLPRVSYDPVKGMTPVSMLGAGSYALVVKASQPWKSLRELVDHAKANPGKLSYATGNLGGILYMELLKKAAGIDVIHVPYKATPPALVDVMSGEVHMMFTDVGLAAAQVRGGKVRALATTSSSGRSPILPEVPTLDEAGLPGIVDMPGWLAIYGPPGMPKEIASHLSRAITAVLKRPEVYEKVLANYGFVLEGSSPDQLGTYTAEQYQRYVRLLKEFNIQPLQ